MSLKEIRSIITRVEALWEQANSLVNFYGDCGDEEYLYLKYKVFRDICKDIIDTLNDWMLNYAD